MNTRAYTYRVTIPPADLAVSLELAKSHLKVTSKYEDDLITMYLEAAITYAEEFTRRDLLTRTYQTFRDGFYEPIELRKSKLQEITSIEYLENGSWLTLSSDIYYATESDDFSQICLKVGKLWPTNVDLQKQSVRITFTCGYGTASAISSNWKLAILNHLSYLYANRGDCSEKSIKESLPPTSRTFYLQNRIEVL